MDAPNAFAAGHRARRYCIPTIIQSNRVDCRPRPLGVLKRSVSSSFATPVTKVTPFGGQYTPNWNYFYYNPRPSFNVEKTYFGDPRNVYWTGKHSNLPAINTFDRKETTSANCRDFHNQKHWNYPFSYWATYYYWN
uniref:Uncharacterized protein n=3 Tax=Meloidogyne TaxID=189290 RepID=A0A6V7V8Q5_MELEN|nr:unnamed protein product [Meloidogyne enterolobii]CAD2195079.1 unnamed protein product [Meloidogyne enterolobii]